MGWILDGKLNNNVANKSATLQHMICIKQTTSLYMYHNLQKKFQIHSTDEMSISTFTCPMCHHFPHLQHTSCRFLPLGK